MATDWESVYSGQKATDARMEVMRLACKVCGGLQDDCECGEKALERISELEAKLAAKWISVTSESMPEYDTLVRLWNPLWPCASVGYWRHSHEWIGYFAPETHGPLPETNPTHWQPLPDPPVQP